MRKIYTYLFVVVFGLVIWFQSDLGAIAESDLTSDLTRVLIANLNQASQLQRQGLYRRSRQQLERLELKLAAAPDSEIKVKGLLQLANILNLTGGTTEHTKLLLNQAQTIAESLDAIEPNQAGSLRALTEFHRGNFYAFQQRPVEAQMAYETALNLNPKTDLTLMIQVRNVTFMFNGPRRESPAYHWRSVVEKVEREPLNLTSLYLRLELAELALKNPTLVPLNQTQAILTEALQTANFMHDRQAATYTLSNLGQLHWLAGRYGEADRNAHQALRLAQRLNNPNLIYRNLRLLGQLDTRLNHQDQARVHYQSAIDTLRQISYDLVATSPSLQFEFREEVEPVYRDLVDLILTPDSNGVISQSSLKEAQGVMDSLRDAELVNYFREACWDVVPQEIDKLDALAAIVYPIVLNDRLEVIWTVPGQPIQHYMIPVSQANVELQVSKMRQALRSTALASERNPLAMQLYDWLIRPALPQIISAQVKTLVFNPDTAFQLIPMGVLHDGKQYLIEQYAIATTPGLKLRSGKSLNTVDWKRQGSFIGGISEASGESVALPGVMSELNTIAHDLRSSVVMNQALTKANLRTALVNSPIALLHLATHGQFSADPSGTFLNLWDARLQVEDIAQLFEERTTNGLPPIELLVLSACQTAQGDRRAALGIAGIAIQSGARSTIASLWTVDDDSTAKLMEHLYHNLDIGMTRSEALRQAKLVLLRDPEFSNPYYWSAFTLLGVWW